jgi:hypothetical protein
MQKDIPSRVFEEESESSEIRIKPRETTMLLAIVGGILAALSIGQHLYAGDSAPIGRINLDTELSIPTWFEAALLLFSGVLVVLIAITRSQASRPYVRHWVVAAGALAVMSVDEMLAIHEELIDPLRSLLDAGGPIYFAWVVPGAILVVVFAAAYLKFLAHLPRATRKLLLIAGALYLGGALGMEAVNGAYASAHGQENLVYMLLTDLEEVLEMGGLLVLVYALLSFLGELGVSVRVAQSARAARVSVEREDAAT